MDYGSSENTDGEDSSKNSDEPLSVGIFRRTIVCRYFPRTTFVGIVRGTFSDLVIKGVVDLVEAEIASQSQPLSDNGDSTGASTAVPKRKGGRLVGLAHRASSYPASSSQALYADSMILEELHDKDERIGALE
ncbi:hypothetical protein F2Q70_00002434 [Brassica cretica]|uniref:Uncharacterized protein n=1 Tax=Brassica cretica TaxID=69181 RepID=A0A8S9J3W5_BRACR|nr:hypothetical protein F2Q70_00002434 [Brassica cretica]